MEMTEFTDRVEKQRILMEAEEWGSGVKHIHANNGIIETAYQNGNVHYEDTKTGRKWTVYSNHSQGTIVEKFRKWLSDRKGHGS
tara:strand:+ start:88 stop:339 length:252 start_codon:yes stop_codon:yes gene_type:complete